VGFREISWAAGMCLLSAGCVRAPPAGGADASAADADLAIADAAHDDAGSADAMPEIDDAFVPDAFAERDAFVASQDASVAPSWDPYAVLSLNLHCLLTAGTAYATNVDRFAGIAALVAREQVKLILAQEVCERPGESARAQLAAALALATGERWSSEWTYTHDAWIGTPDEAREGVAIFARGTLGGTVAVDYRAQSVLRRVMLTARADEALGGARFATVHLEHAEAAVRERQAAESAAAALAISDPSLDLVIGGDLNAIAQSDAWSRFSEMGFVDATASLDARRIDHLFVHRGAALVASSPRLVFTGQAEPRVSDHPGVLVTLAPGPRATIVATRFAAAGSTPLSVRGDRAPLSWERGWPAWSSGGMSRLVVTELAAGPFEYKWLERDEVWQRGPNLAGAGGQDQLDSPSF